MASRMLAQNPDALIATSSSKYDPKVAQLQQRLNAEGYRDQNGRPLAVDGVMGPLTQYASQQQSAAMANNVAGGPTNWTIGEGGVIVGSKNGVYQGFTIPNTPTSGGMASSVRNTPTSISAMNPQIGQLFSTLQSRASAPLAAPESTPQYAAAKTRLQQEGAEASTRAVQGMAARGVLRSSMTEDAMKRIEADIVDRLTTQVAPQIQSQLMAQRESELGGIRSDLAMALQMAGMDASQAMQAAQMAEQGRQFDIGAMYQRAQLERQMGADKLDDLYRLAGLTGRIPEGLPGAGGLTAEEAYRRAQLARGTGGTTTPNVAGGIRDQLLTGLNNGTINEEDLQPWQRDLIGLPQERVDTTGSEVLATVVAGLQQAVATAKTPQQREAVRQSEMQDIEALRIAGLIGEAEYAKALQLLNMYFPPATTPATTAAGASNQDLLNQILNSNDYVRYE
jgi:peptidoglycan hydrolase-like protein with peptidoglycan-binding domain